MSTTVNGADFSHLMLENNPHWRVNTIINYTLLFNQNRVLNHLLKPLMCLVSLGETIKNRMDQVLYYSYKTDEHM